MEGEFLTLREELQIREREKTNIDTQSCIRVKVPTLRHF